MLVTVSYEDGLAYLARNLIRQNPPAQDRNWRIICQPPYAMRPYEKGYYALSPVCSELECIIANNLFKNNCRRQTDRIGQLCAKKVIVFFPEWKNTRISVSFLEKKGEKNAPDTSA